MPPDTLSSPKPEKEKKNYPKKISYIFPKKHIIYYNLAFQFQDQKIKKAYPDEVSYIFSKNVLPTFQDDYGD